MAAGAREVLAAAARRLGPRHPRRSGRPPAATWPSCAARTRSACGCPRRWGRWAWRRWWPGSGCWTPPRPRCCGWACGCGSIPRDRLAAAALVRILEHPDDAAAFVTRVLDPDAPRAPEQQPGRGGRPGGPGAGAGSGRPAGDRRGDRRPGPAAAVRGVGQRGPAHRQPGRPPRPRQQLLRRAPRRRGRPLAGRASWPIWTVWWRKAAGAKRGATPPPGWAPTTPSPSRPGTPPRAWSGPSSSCSAWSPSAPRRLTASTCSPTARTFDVNDPLGGRWIHFWPNPYTNSVQKGPVKDAYAASPAFQQISHQGRARGPARPLRRLDPRPRPADPRRPGGQAARRPARHAGGHRARPDRRSRGATTAGPVAATWAGHTFQLQVDPCQPARSRRRAARGRVHPHRAEPAPVEYAAATLAPSSAPSRPGRLGEAVRLGPPLRIQGTVEVDDLGTAVHAFLAADDPAASRRAGDTRWPPGCLQRYGVAGALEPAAAGRAGRPPVALGAHPVRRVERRPHGVAPGPAPGQRNGRARHGRPPGRVRATPSASSTTRASACAAASTRAESLAGQLGCYADAVARARPGQAVSTWVHLPFDGVIVPLLLDATASLRDVA